MRYFWTAKANYDIADQLIYQYTHILPQVWAQSVWRTSY